MSLEDDAKRFLRDKRIIDNKIKPADAAANALSAVREELRDFLCGNRPLNPEHLLQMCNVGLA